MTQNLPETRKKNDRIAKKEDVRGRNEELIPHKPEGGTYSVSGKEAPTSKQVQLWANEQAISVEIVEVGKNNEMAWARMRAINNDTGQTVEDEVILLYADVQERKMIDLVDKSVKNAPRNAKKTPLIKDLNNPILVDENGMVLANLTPRGIIHMKKQMVNYKYTAERTAQTMATRRVQDKILNREWKSKEEKDAERMERNMVEESISNERRPPVREEKVKPREKEDKQDEPKKQEKKGKKAEKQEKKETKTEAPDEPKRVEGLRTFSKKQQEELKNKTIKSKSETKTEEQPHENEEETSDKTEVNANEIIDQADGEELGKLNPMSLVDRLIAKYKDTGKKPTKSVIQKSLDYMQNQKMIEGPKHMICSDYLGDLNL